MRDWDCESIPKGAVFFLSSGSYSDYTVCCAMKALEDIEPKALLVDYLKEHPGREWTPSHPPGYTYIIYCEYSLPHWLIDKGYAEELTVIEWHYLGSEFEKPRLTLISISVGEEE